MYVGRRDPMLGGDLRNLFRVTLTQRGEEDARLDGVQECSLGRRVHCAPPALPAELARVTWQ